MSFILISGEFARGFRETLSLLFTEESVQSYQSMVDRYNLWDGALLFLKLLSYSIPTVQLRKYRPFVVIYLTVISWFIFPCQLFSA